MLTGRTHVPLPGAQASALALTVAALVSASAASAQTSGTAGTVAGASTTAGDGGPAAGAASDGTVLEEILVTARRRTETAQTTPVAVSAISGDQIDVLNITRLSGVDRLAPNIKVTQASGSANASVIFIRGIGTITTAMYAEPAVGLYLDGVYMPRQSGNAFDLPDIERVEVLRGPQGTLFGRNTTGGAVLLATETPAEHAKGSVDLSYGNNDEVVLSGVIHTGEISDTGFKLKFSGQVHNREGWHEFAGANKSDWGGNQSAVTFGAALRGDLGNLTVDYRARYAKIDSFTGWQVLNGTPAALAAYNAAAAANSAGPPFLVSAKPLDFGYRNPRSVGNSTIEGYGNTLTLDYEVNDALQLRSISGYHRLDQNLPGHLGGTYVLGRVLNPEVPGNAIEPISVHTTPANPGEQEQFSQELQALGDVGRLSYVVGLYYWNEEVEEEVRTVLNSPSGGAFVRVNRSVPYSQQTKSWAGFAQLAFKPALFDDRLEISGGIRYTKDEKDLVSQTISKAVATTTTSQVASDSWDNVGWSGSLSYRWTPSIMTYARVASSYRAGGFNAIATGSPGFDPETAVSYEAGLKSDMFDRRLRLNVTAFRTEYDDLQVNQYNSTTLTNFIVNAAKATYDGVEVEGVLLLGDNFQIDGNLGYIDAEYQEYILLLGGVPTNVGDTAHFPYLSKWQTHIGGQFKSDETPAGTFTLRVDYSTKSSARLAAIDFLSPTLNTYRTGAEKNLSARIIWADIPVSDAIRLQAQVYGENLTNNRYLGFATDFGTLGTGTFNRPRSYGVRLSAEF